jgi:golgi phosphoprotein 3
MILKTYDYLFLLAINPSKNKIYFISRASIDYAIAGALIYELMKEGLVSINNNELIINKENTEDNVLKETLLLIKKINKKSVRKNTSAIANRIYSIKDIFLKELENKKILTIEEGKLLGIFQNNKYIIIENDILSSFVIKLKSIINKEIEATTNEVMILNMVEACSLTKKVFPDKKDSLRFKTWLKEKEN